MGDAAPGRGAEPRARPSVRPSARAHVVGRERALYFVRRASYSNQLRRYSPIANFFGPVVRELLALPVGGRRQLLLLPVAVEVPVRPPLPVGGRRQLLLLPGAE